MQPNYSQYTIKLVTCIQYMGGQLEQAIDFNVACYEELLYPQRKNIQIYI